MSVCSVLHSPTNNHNIIYPAQDLEIVEKIQRETAEPLFVSLVENRGKVKAVFQGDEVDGQGRSMDGEGAKVDGPGSSMDGQGAKVNGQGSSMDGQGASKEDQGDKPADGAQEDLTGGVPTLEAVGKLLDAAKAIDESADLITYLKETVGEGTQPFHLGRTVPRIIKTFQKLHLLPESTQSAFSAWKSPKKREELFALITSAYDNAKNAGKAIVKACIVGALVDFIKKITTDTAQVAATRRAAGFGVNQAAALALYAARPENAAKVAALKQALTREARPDVLNNEGREGQLKAAEQTIVTEINAICAAGGFAFEADMISPAAIGEEPALALRGVEPNKGVFQDTDKGRDEVSALLTRLVNKRDELTTRHGRSGTNDSGVAMYVEVFTKFLGIVAKDLAAFVAFVVWRGCDMNHLTRVLATKAVAGFGALTVVPSTTPGGTSANSDSGRKRKAGAGGSIERLTEAITSVAAAAIPNRNSAVNAANVAALAAKEAETKVATGQAITAALQDEAGLQVLLSPTQNPARAAAQLEHIKDQLRKRVRTLWGITPMVVAEPVARSDAI